MLRFLPGSGDTQLLISYMEMSGMSGAAPDAHWCDWGEQRPAGSLWGTDRLVLAMSPHEAQLHCWVRILPQSLQEKALLPLTTLIHAFPKSVSSSFCKNIKLIPLEYRDNCSTGYQLPNSLYVDWFRHPLLTISLAQTHFPPSLPSPELPRLSWSVPAVPECPFCGCEHIPHVADQLHTAQQARASQIRCLMTAVGHWLPAEAMLRKCSLIAFHYGVSNLLEARREMGRVP